MNYDLTKHLVEYEKNGYTIIRNVLDKNQFLKKIETIDKIIVNNKDKVDIYYESDGKTIKKIEKLLYNNNDIKE